MSAIRKIFPTEGRAKTKRKNPVDHVIMRSPGATDSDAVNAFLTDLLRRHRAGELACIKVDAQDKNGDRLKYRM
jgi:hypothetical protein